MIRLARPDIDDEDIEAVAAVLRSGFLVQGEHVARFEAALARTIGVEHAVAVTNGTAALHLALLAAGVGPGATVAVTAYSWVATANVIELVGATPLFVDIDPVTFNIDPEALAAAVDGAAGRVAAVLPVDAFGQIADLPRITEIADACGAVVIEDAACALGAALDDRPAGTWGKAGCFSFHPRKAVTTGEGGLITTADEAFADHVRALRNHGQDPVASSPDFVVPGFNCRMTEMQAALGVVQLGKAERLVRERRRLARAYGEVLDGLDLATPSPVAEERHVWQAYVVLLPAALRGATAAFITAMRGRGVEAQIGTWHIPMTRWFRERYGFGPGDYPVADDVFERAIALPLWPGMTDDQQREVRDAVAACITDLAG